VGRDPIKSGTAHLLPQNAEAALAIKCSVGLSNGLADLLYADTIPPIGEVSDFNPPRRSDGSRKNRS
jgi:hypothetical protein